MNVKKRKAWAKRKVRQYFEWPRLTKRQAKALKVSAVWFQSANSIEWNCRKQRILRELYSLELV